MNRKILLLAVLTATVLQTAAASHPVDRFDACEKPRGIEIVHCRNKTEVGRGIEVVLRAELAPPHVGASASVMRLEPHADRWERVAITPILEGGIVRWYWTPRERHVRNYTPWQFRLKVRDHGWSDIVKVLIRSDEF